jgi:hypothetical protein
LSHREAARTAILYAFDLIEHDGEDLRNLPFLDRKAALTRLLRDAKVGILLNEHIAEDGPTVFAHACRNLGDLILLWISAIGLAVVVGVAYFFAARLGLALSPNLTALPCSVPRRRSSFGPLRSP